ncbi:phosphate acyltransferase PlsX [Filifactor villosus]|uniref:Phosphate acyltransferase n=1 Tax=Filifactor villosus TaxID=29374 RepID=A0ABV9QM59_9FIRM
MIHIGIDAMGGDHAPAKIVEGAILATQKDKELVITLFGKSEEIDASLASLSYDKQRINIVTTTEVIEGEDKPVHAIRKKKDSSLVVALTQLKEKKLDAVVSAGNTGALIAGAIFVTGRIRGISRPAITGAYPTIKGPMVTLDIGANADVSPQHLLEFAKMGSLFSKIAYHKENPTVGLVNIGTEATKGNELTKAAYALLKEEKSIRFAGNVEGRDIPKGIVDVLVCDGFTGNTVLKLTEGVADTLFSMLKQAIESNAKAKLGALMMKDSLKKMKESLNYEEVGGAVLLGVDGVVVKAHGSSKEKAFSNAILRAAQYHREGLVDKIKAIVKEESTEK